MLRKLSLAVLLALGAGASGAQIQRKVSSLSFCANPLHGQLPTFAWTVSAGAVASLLEIGDKSPLSFTARTNGAAKLRPGVCAGNAADPVGTWSFNCQGDVLAPVLVRITDVAEGGVATRDALKADCAVANVAPTLAQAGVDQAICTAEILVTENNPQTKFPGAAEFYGFVPAVTYTLVGGFQSQPFTNNVQAGQIPSRFCIFWPSFTGTGRAAGGTNKWSKPVVKAVTTTAAFTNAPATDAAKFLAPANLFDDVFPAVVNGGLLSPIYQEDITVNYHKTYLNWNQI